MTAAEAQRAARDYREAVERQHDDVDAVARQAVDPRVAVTIARLLAGTRIPRA